MVSRCRFRGEFGIATILEKVLTDVPQTVASIKSLYGEMEDTVKAKNYRETLKRHPFLRSLLKMAPFVGAEYEAKPQDIQYIAVRPLAELSNDGFATFSQEFRREPLSFAVDAELWSVIFYIKEDEGQNRGSGYRYCDVRFTREKSTGGREFMRGEIAGEGITPEMSVRDYIAYWDRFYRKYGVTPEFVAVVRILRSWSVGWNILRPQKVVVYQ